MHQVSGLLDLESHPSAVQFDSLILLCCVSRFDWENGTSRPWNMATLSCFEPVSTQITLIESVCINETQTTTQDDFCCKSQNKFSNLTRPVWEKLFLNVIHWHCNANVLASVPICTIYLVIFWYVPFLFNMLNVRSKQ